MAWVGHCCAFLLFELKDKDNVSKGWSMDKALVECSMGGRVQAIITVT